MKVTTEELEQCQVLLTIEIDSDQEQNLLKKAAKRIARQVNVPGFRRGKAPFNTIVRRFGWEVVQQEALEQSSEKLIKEALEEIDIEPYAQAELDEIGWNPLVIKIKIPVKPKVELGNYRDIRLEAEPVEVSEEDVEQTLKAIQEQNATWTPVERPSEIGDLISMSVTEKDGDQVLVENESAEYELTPPDERVGNQPDLTTPLLDLSAGDSKTFTLTYPDEFGNEKYAGKEITFTVEVSGVKIKELDPLDDEFAQQVSDFDTLEELREDIRERIKKQREQQRDLDLGFAVLDKLIEQVEKLAWPQTLEEEHVKEALESYEQRLKRVGITLDSYLKVENKTKEELREEVRADVITRLKRGLVLNKVAELEKLDVSQSEILEQAKLISDYSGGDERVWQNILSSESQQNMIARDLLSNKAVHRLAAIAKGEAPEPTRADEEEAAAVDEAESDDEEQATAAADQSAEPAPEMTPDETVNETASETEATVEMAASILEVEADEVTSDISQAAADEDKSDRKVIAELTDDTSAGETVIAKEN